MSDFSFYERRQPADGDKPIPWFVLPSLAALVLLIYAGTLVASCFFADNTLRNMMFGSSPPMAMFVLGYFFGNSVGKVSSDAAAAATSIKQAETIAEQGKALAVSAPPPTVTTVTSDPGPPPKTTVTTAPAPEGPPETTPAEPAPKP